MKGLVVVAQGLKKEEGRVGPFFGVCWGGVWIAGRTRKKKGRRIGGGFWRMWGWWLVLLLLVLDPGLVVQLVLDGGSAMVVGQAYSSSSKRE